MDYGHVTPPPQNFLPPWQHYSPMYQQPLAPMSPMPQYMNYQQFPYTEQQQPPATYPYYYYPYYVPEMWYSSPPQLPTRDGVTGEPQCRIL